MASSVPTDTRATDLTTITVRVNGESLPDRSSIVTVEITHEVNRVPVATLVIQDGDAALQDFKLSGSELLKPGGAIEINGGYGMKESLLFSGVITAQRVRVKRRGESLLELEARSPVFRMTLDRRSRYYKNVSDSDLFEEIIGRYTDLKADVEPTKTKIPEVTHYQVSDWDFIVGRAERMGLMCICEKNRFRVVKPDLSQEPVSTLAYGVNIFDLDLTMDARSQPKKITVSAWDPSSNELISGESEDVSTPAQGDMAGTDLAKVSLVENLELRHSGSLQQESVESWAGAAMLKSRFARIRGTVRVQGSPALFPGKLVSLEGLGARFNGKAIVTGVRHTLGDGDWESVVQLGFDPTWHHERYALSSPPAAGLNAAVTGLHPGIVTQLEDDPDGEDRILVRIPTISSAEEGIWSRVATLDAGKNRGSVFHPEIGDEVIVGFMQGDPNDPIVLGAMHSSYRPAPIAGSDKNHQKGMVTRSGMKLMFDDDATSMTLETPDKRRIVLNDDDDSIVVSDNIGNTMTMNADGIALNSKGKIVLKASGDITLEGMNVSIKATAAAKVSGSTQATLESSASTVVKGSLVRIN